MTEVRAFTGFPKEGIRFFSDIAANNNREWFQAHKQDYLDNLQAPALAFLVEFGEKLKQIAPGINYDTRTNGAGSLMRIYRDIRFSKDKRPYKDHIGVNFWEGAGKNEAPGFHFWMDARGPLIEPTELQSPKLIDTCLKQARVLIPLHQWFVEVHQLAGA